MLEGVAAHADDREARLALVRYWPPAVLCRGQVPRAPRPHPHPDA
jgi:hypothetical protein